MRMANDMARRQERFKAWETHVDELRPPSRKRLKCARVSVPRCATAPCRTCVPPPPPALVRGPALVFPCSAPVLPRPKPKP
jgi:hypothetical protein